MYTVHDSRARQKKDAPRALNDGTGRERAIFVSPLTVAKMGLGLALGVPAKLPGLEQRESFTFVLVRYLIGTVSEELYSYTWN